jgi:RNA polymerase sigma-70 factor (ECF subfamily)
MLALPNPPSLSTQRGIDKGPRPASRRPTPEEVFHAFAPRVYRLARRMLDNDTDAEDVSQDVLVQVVRKLHTFRAKAEVTTWLHRVTGNAALAHRRRLARCPQRPLDVPLDCLQGQGSGASCGPDGQALNRELRRHLEAAVGRLPAMYRDVFVLADVEELPNAEIGRLLGLSLAAVKSRLHRACLMLRDALTPYLGAASG